MAKSEHAARRVVTLAVIAALLWPLITNNDSLPLSTYPMYSGTRSDNVAFVTASAVDSAGHPVELSMPEIAQTRDPLIAQSFLNDAVAFDTVDRVCREIASRLDRTRAVRVEIAREVHDVVEFVRDGASLVTRTLIVGCELDT